MFLKILNKTNRHFQRCFVKYRQYATATNEELTMKYEEVKIKVPWGHITGKWWGPQDKRPILCVHGWQDNCGTFDTLIPALPNHLGYLAIDMPGHGLSSQLPKGIFYHGIDSSILIQRLQSYFGWPKVSLMGHSMGAILSFVYTSLFPETVDMLICLDALKPFSQVPGGQIKITAKNIEKFIRYDNLNSGDTKPPVYEYDEIINKLHLGTRKSIDRDKCHYILERSIEKCGDEPNKYYFSRDSRLKVGVLMGFSQEDILEHAKKIKCPHLFAKATRSSYFEDKKYVYETINVMKETNKNFEHHRIEGTHHVHLNEPEKVAAILNPFIKKHDNVDRSVGGIKSEIKLNS